MEKKNFWDLLYFVSILASEYFQGLRRRNSYYAAYAEAQYFIEAEYFVVGGIVNKVWRYLCAKDLEIASFENRSLRCETKTSYRMQVCCVLLKKKIASSTVYSS